MGHKQRQFFSLKSKIEWEAMNEQQRRFFVIEMKSQIALMFIQATFLIKTKNLIKARELFMKIADSCMCIREPDSQVQKWTDISCRYIGLLHLHKQKEQESNSMSEQKQPCVEPDLIKLKYNRVLNQFEVEAKKSQTLQEKGTIINQNILNHISRINSILFANKNVGVSSIIVMLASYWIPFLFIFLTIFLSFFLLARGEILKNIFGQNLQSIVPQSLLCFSCILALLFMFLKTPYQKSNIFFQKKIIKCISQINKDCKIRELNYEFFRLSEGTIQIKKTTKNVREQLFGVDPARLYSDYEQKPLQNSKVTSKTSKTQNFGILKYDQSEKEQKLS